MPRPRALFILLLFSALFASAASAQRRVTGRVTDQTSGQPVPGAAIQILGTPFGTSAADDGTFAIQAPDGPVTLIARRIGYQRREIPIAAGSTTAWIRLPLSVSLPAGSVPLLPAVLIGRSAPDIPAGAPGCEMDAAGSRPGSLAR